MDADINQLPVWIIQGTNWLAEVPLDEYNTQFDNETQAHEAATRVIEYFKMEHENKLSAAATRPVIIVQFLNNTKSPELGGIVMAYLVDTNPHDALLLYVHELLANGGFYKDSYIVRAMTDAVLKEQNAVIEQAMDVIKKNNKKPIAQKPKKQAKKLRKSAKKPKAKRKPKKPKK